MKTYYFTFGVGDPANFTGLSPTFTIFSANGLTALAPPGVTETPAGSGLYRFQYEPTTSIVFVIDGGSVLSSGERYIVNALDPIQAVDERVGVTADSFGDSTTDPTTVFGYVKRLQEFNEGDAVYTKATGVWDVSSRGASALIASKTLTNDPTQATKS